MNFAQMTRSELRAFKRLAAAFLLCAATSLAASAQTLTTLANFSASPRPNSPSTLIQGFDGNFYGTTMSGVASGECQSSRNSLCGTVFRMTPAGKLTVLHSFCTQANCPDGQMPSSLVQAIDGNLYGTTYGGGSGCPVNAVPGCGTIYRIDYAGNLTTLYSFCVKTNCPDGSGPGSLVKAPNGVIYGTTSGGGVNNFGTVFKATTVGKVTTLHSFNNTDGADPGYGLVLGSDGNIYGTTYFGGNVNCPFNSAGCGVIFRMTLGGSMNTIYTFCVISYDCFDGANPTGLVEGADGNYYGTTYEGGSADSESQCGSGADGFGCGTIFRVTPTGSQILTTIYNVCGDNYCDLGSNPVSPMVLGNDGNFYGTTFNGGIDFGGGNCNFACGTVFEITPSGSLTSLHSFNWTDGAYPTTLLQSTNGTFYGTTGSGGSDGSNISGYGTIYRLSTGLAAFVTADPGGGNVGTKTIISGTNLTGTTAVSFNGTSAQFTAVTKTELIATVPAGATTGFITVTTPSGTLKSNVTFEVIP